MLLLIYLLGAYQVARRDFCRTYNCWSSLKGLALLFFIRVVGLAWKTAAYAVGYWAQPPVQSDIETRHADSDGKPFGDEDSNRSYQGVLWLLSEYLSYKMNKNFFFLLLSDGLFMLYKSVFSVLCIAVNGIPNMFVFFAS